MEHKIVPLPKDEWKGTPIMMKYTTEEYYDLEISESDEAFGARMIRKKFEIPVTHTPEEYDFPDGLYQDHWENAEAYGIYTEENGKKTMMACIEVCPEEWSNRLMVTELWVHDTLHRQGIGTALMNKAKEIARAQGRRAIILETQSCNVRAIAFYRSQGFELLGFDKCCYTNRDIERHEIRFNFVYYMDRRAGRWTEKEIFIKRTLETDRLLLRHWEESDAEDLFNYACDPDVGPIAGWPPHQNVDESLNVIRNVFNGKEAYAICLKEDGKAIGAVELKLYGSRGNGLAKADNECELGYWLGKPFWGRGIMPEAVREMLRHAFEDLGMQKVWCGYYEGNSKSKRVQEKCGFRYQWKAENVDVTLMHEKRTEHVNLLTKEDWETRKNEGNEGS